MKAGRGAGRGTRDAIDSRAERFHRSNGPLGVRTHLEGRAPRRWRVGAPRDRRALITPAALELRDSCPARANAAPLAMGTLAAVMAAIFLPASREVGLRGPRRDASGNAKGRADLYPHPGGQPVWIKSGELVWRLPTRGPTFAKRVLFERRSNFHLAFFSQDSPSIHDSGVRRETGATEEEGRVPPPGIPPWCTSPT